MYVPVNMGGAHLCLSMLVHQSWLQVHRFIMDMSFFLLRTSLSFVGFQELDRGSVSEVQDCIILLLYIWYRID